MSMCTSRLVRLETSCLSLSISAPLRPMMMPGRAVNAHDKLVRRALDIDGTDAGRLELFLQLFAELDVFVEQVGIIAIGIPARLPRLVVAEAESVWMCFLSHNFFARSLPDRLLFPLLPRRLLARQSFANTARGSANA